MKYYFINKKSIIILFTLIILSTFGCSVNNNEKKLVAESTANFAVNDVVANTKMMAVAQPLAKAVSDDTLASDKKVIKTVDINAETKTFEDTIDWLKTYVDTFKADITSSYIDSGDKTDENFIRTANFVIKVPAEKLDAFLSKIARNVNITFQQENAQDVTERYDDTEARLNTLKLEEIKLNELMVKAKSIDELLKIEEKLADIRREIQTIATSLKRLDSKITYATVSITLTEVKVLTDAIDKDNLSKDNLLKMLNKNIEAAKNIVINIGAYLFTHIPFIILGFVAFIVLIILIIIIKSIFSNNKSDKKYYEKKIVANTTTRNASRRRKENKPARVEKSTDGRPIV